MKLKELISQKLQANFPEAEFEFSEYRNEFNVKFNKKFVNPICKFLKEDSELEFLLCEDKDLEDLKSTIYKLTIKKTTR